MRVGLILRGGTLAIFSGFRRLFEAIEELARAMERLAKAQEDVAPAVERLDALELSRFQFEAEVAGVLLEAKGKLRAASNSEARERQLKKSRENNIDPFGEGGEEVAEAGRAVLPLNAARSEEERMSALRLDLAGDPKAAAVIAKWSR